MPEITAEARAAEIGSLSLKTAKGAGWVIAWRIATRNLGLASTLILARLLAPTDFGLVALATGFIAAVEALSAVGVQDALIRERAPDRDLYDTAFTMSLLRAAATAVLVAAAAWALANFFSEPRLVPILLALAAGTLISGFENIGIVDFRRDLAFHKEFRLQLTGRVVSVIVTVALAIILHSYWALVAGLLVARLVRLVQSYTMSPFRPRLALNSWRRIIGFSLWTWAASIVFMVRDRIESIIIGRAFGAATVGVFALGVEIGALPTTELVEPLCRALYSGFAEANRTGLSPGRVFVRVVSAALLLTVPAAVGISLLADPLVRIALGPQWIAAVPLVWILALPGAAMVISNVSGTALYAEGLPHLNFQLGAATTVLKVLLMVALVYAFGLIGGAVAVALSLMIEQVVYLEAARRRLAVDLAGLARGTWRTLVATATMAVVLVACGLGWAHADDGAIGAPKMAIIGTLIGAAAYAVTLLALWVVSGRPEGAESDALRILHRGVGRLWLGARVARPAVGS